MVFDPADQRRPTPSAEQTVGLLDETADLVRRLLKGYGELGRRAAKQSGDGFPATSGLRPGGRGGGTPDPVHDLVERQVDAERECLEAAAGDQRLDPADCRDPDPLRRVQRAIGRDVLAAVLRLRHAEHEMERTRRPRAAAGGEPGCVICARAGIFSPVRLKARGWCRACQDDVARLDREPTIEEVREREGRRVEREARGTRRAA